ncbi:hypothetical protein TKK_0007554 [Trichogramma kaykai]|uniref:Uncharacterized protein n=1 Tax=Trichogramma kaykai TaxID=54128 RepID=A0ABD2WGE5_9HYME
MLADTSLTSTIECSTGLPQHFALYNIFLAYCATEIKGAIVDLYIRYEDAKRSENQLSVESFKQAFSDALFDATVNVKTAMWTASRSYWSCRERMSVYMTEGG